MTFASTTTYRAAEKQDVVLKTGRGGNVFCLFFFSDSCCHNDLARLLKIENSKKIGRITFLQLYL